jgi:hypothetical protein
MQTLLRLTIAFTTLIIGIGVSFLFRSPRSQPSIQPVKVVAEVRVNPPVEEAPAVPQVQVKEKTDLTIGVEVQGLDPTRDVIPVALGSDRQAIIDLDLAETIDGQQLTLKFPDSSGSYRILQRYRTSMSIAAEGPHLDLVDWRHFDSEWIPLKSLGARRFRTLKSSEMDETKFPPTTKQEIVAEVRKRVEKDWPELLEYVEGCPGPNEGACLVGISSLYLRVQKRVGDSWIDVGLVEVRLAMGC